VGDQRQDRRLIRPGDAPAPILRSTGVALDLLFAAEAPTASLAQRELTRQDA